MNNNAQTINLPVEVTPDEVAAIPQTGVTANTRQEVPVGSGDTVISSLAPKILTSEEDLVRVKPYTDLLKKTIDQAGVTNIALTGNYGSGKSTLINTFLWLHRDYEPLRISLASFGNVAEKVAEEEGEVKVVEGDTGTNGAIIGSIKKPLKVAKDSKATKEKKEELERLLEVSILQQIFYHVKPSVIPDSRFKRITNIKDDEIYGIAVSFVLWVASAFILFKFDYIDRINPSSWHISWSFDWWAVPVFLIFFAGVGVFAKNIVRLLNNSKINKVNIKGELELGDKLDKSVFNEHLEEILYFFERTKFNLVVIEDLDRFDSTDIFTKLRELNTLLNNSLSIKERKDHREIVFLYAISDETFKDKNERVKFFEYIIPVIPFINPTNAGDQLAKLIKEAKIEDARFKDFTEDLVTFIDDIDMRLLINIFHEYQLYRDNLSPVLQQDKLFAIITYKNMFPEDFSKLHSRKGILYEFLSGRVKYIKRMTDEIDQQLAGNLAEIDNIESLKVENVEDLRSLYIKAIYTKFPGAIAIKVGKQVNFAELIEYDNFKLFSQSNKIEYYYYQQHSDYGSYVTERKLSSISNVSFADLEKIVNPGFTYQERVKQLIDALAGKEDELKQENDLLRGRKLAIESWSLSEIFEEVDIDPYIHHFSDNGLIRNLLLNGYIDENYADYISLFHEVNMSAEDFAFEKQVKSGTASAFDYKLSSTAYLIKKINDKYFSREVILNLDLVCCLLGEEEAFVEKRSKIFALLASEKERSVSFIDEFVSKRPEQAGAFMRLLAANWPGCWNYLEKKSGYSADKLNSYLKLLVTNAQIDHLIDLGSSIGIYISKKSDYFSLFSTDSEKASARVSIERLGVRFANLLPPNDQTAHLFDFVYNNSYYQINTGNILLMLAEKGGGISLEKARKSNYSAIQQSECEPLKKYVERSIITYLQNVFLKLPENKEEEEPYMLTLLNNANIGEELKISIVRGGYVMIGDLAAVDDYDIRQQIVAQNCMVTSWKNVFVYYDGLLFLREQGSENRYFDDVLLDYFNLEENYLKLQSQSMAPDGAHDEGYLGFFAIQIMVSNDLDDNAYKALMATHYYIYDTEDLAALSADKVGWALDQGRIELNNHTYDQLKEHFPELHIKLVEKQQSELAKQIDQLVIQKSDTITLLGSNVLTRESKLVIYEQLSDDMVIASAAISRLGCNLLSKSPEAEISYPVMASMFKHSVSIGDKIRLLNMHLSALAADQVQSLIESLGGDYPEIFIKRHKPKFSKEEFHTVLFTKLKASRMIKTFEPHEKDEYLWRVFANY